MTYPNMTPPSSPWAMRMPDLPGQRGSDPHLQHAEAVSEDDGQATMVIDLSGSLRPNTAREQESDSEAPTAVVDEITEPAAEPNQPAGSATTDDNTYETDETPELDMADVIDVVNLADEAPAADVMDAGDIVNLPDRDNSAPATASPHRPGDVVGSPISLWKAADAAAFRARFAQVLPLFIDDPSEAVAQATAVVNDAVDALAEALRTQHESINPRNADDSPDTESLRVALRDYRSFLDRMLAL